MSRIWVSVKGLARCKRCCTHAVPLSSMCLWCEDQADGYDDCTVYADEPQWLCAHGIGTPFGEDHLGLHSDDFLATLRILDADMSDTRATDAPATPSKPSK